MPMSQELQQLNHQLNKVTFPASKEDIIDRVGDGLIMVEGETFHFRDILNGLPRDEYENKTDVQADLLNLPQFR